MAGNDMAALLTDEDVGISESPEAASIRLSKPAISLESGEQATVRSIGVGDDRGEWVIPTVVGGRVVPNDEAVKLWKSGQNDPIGGPFKTVGEADDYAKRFHEAEARRISGTLSDADVGIEVPREQKRAALQTEMAKTRGEARLGTAEENAAKAAEWLTYQASRLNPVNAVGEASRALGLRPILTPENIDELMQASNRIPLRTPEITDALVLGGEKLGGEIEKGAHDFSTETLSGLTSPEQMAMMAAGVKAPEAVGRAFQTSMIGSTPQTIENLRQSKTPAEATKSVLELASEIALPAAIEKGLTPKVKEVIAKAEPLLPQAAEAAKEALGEPAKTVGPEVVGKIATKEGEELTPTPTPTEQPAPSPAPASGEIVSMGGANLGELPTPGGEDITGIAQRVREKVAASGQEELAPTGEGISAPDAIERGEQVLQTDATAADKAVSAFEADPSKGVSAEGIAVARAKLRQLAIAARRAEEKFGTDSPEYKQAWQERSDWAARVKPMQTEWHKAGMAQQGEVDIDTGSFTGLRSAHLDDTGKDFTPSQAADAKKLAEKVRLAEEAEAKAKAELKVHLEKQQPAKPVDPWILEVADRIAKRVSTSADAARERIKARLGSLKFGLGPLGEIPNIVDYAIIGAEKITKGANEFIRWADDMRKELGAMDDVGLRAIYEAAKKHLTDEIGREPGATPERVKTAKTRAGVIDIPDAEQRALDAANKTVRENATRLSELENKTRQAKSTQERDIAKVEEDRQRAKLEQAQKEARNAAVKAADAENKARVEAAKPTGPTEAEKAEQRALETAKQVSQRAALDLVKAENESRVATAEADKAASDERVKAAQKALDAANKTTREAAVRAAKAEEDARVNPENRVWAKVQEYLEKGEDSFDDIRNKVATDLGMPVKEVTRLLTQSKRGKYLADEAWKAQQSRRLFQEQAKRWLKAADTPLYQKAIAAIPRTMFALKVGFHGTVALGTHAPMVAFQPPFWADYIRNFGKMYRMVGSPTYYEMQVQDLLRNKNYITARRAGLVNDPASFEDFNSPKVAQYFGRLSGMGNRGYSVLKLLRQDMFDEHWDKLPKHLQTSDMAEAISDGVNHATGVVKGMAPAGSNVLLFAPRLEASRVMWLAGDPIRAADTFVRWNKASPAEKRFAINQVKEKAWTIGTLYGLLALNQGMLTATDSGQDINFTDPFHADFLKFKAAGMSGSYGNAMLSMARLPVRMYQIRESDGGKLKNLIYPDENTYTVLGEYGRSQMSPFASLATTLWLKGDWQNRPLPSSDRPVPKRLWNQGVKPYTWPEFFSEQVLPIPAEEAVREVWKNGMGMSDEQISHMRKALATIAVMSATGGRLVDDWQAQPRHSVPIKTDKDVGIKK